MRQGYVSVKAARELYRVVVDAVTFAVDDKGTARLRERRRAGCEQAQNRREAAQTR